MEKGGGGFERKDIGNKGDPPLKKERRENRSGDKKAGCWSKK